MRFLLLILLFPSLLNAQKKAYNIDSSVGVSTTDPRIILQYVGANLDVRDLLWAGGETNLTASVRAMNNFGSRGGSGVAEVCMCGGRQKLNTVKGVANPKFFNPGKHHVQVGVITMDSVYSQIVSKYDTIGGWHLAGDTIRGIWNMVGNVYLYEVRVYEQYLEGLNLRTRKEEYTWVNPKHFKWLDSNYKPFYLKVW